MPDFPVKQKPPALPVKREEKKSFLCICGSTKCEPVEVGGTFAGPIRYNGYVCTMCTVRFFDKHKMTTQAKKLYARLDAMDGRMDAHEHEMDVPMSARPLGPRNS